MAVWVIYRVLGVTWCMVYTETCMWRMYGLTYKDTLSNYWKCQYTESVEYTCTGQVYLIKNIILSMLVLLLSYSAHTDIFRKDDNCIITWPLSRVMMFDTCTTSPRKNLNRRSPVMVTCHAKLVHVTAENRYKDTCWETCTLLGHANVMCLLDIGNRIQIHPVTYQNDNDIVMYLWTFIYLYLVTLNRLCDYGKVLTAPWTSQFWNCW